MRLSPVDRAHAELGAKMLEYGGCSVPSRYGGVAEEYNAARNGAGLFDISHMSAFVIGGNGAAGLLQALSATDMSPLSDGLACRAILCGESGGVIDSFMAYPFADGVLCASGPPYAAACAEYLAERKGTRALTDRTPEYARLALRGPLSGEILRGLKAHTSLIYARRDGFCGHFLLEGVPVFASASSHTPEKGFDLLVPRISALVIWSRMAALGAKPCGLVALDILRVEAGRRACGHELTPEIGPVEAGLARMVAFGKGGFPGREALLKQADGLLGQANTSENIR
ncbi:MAG: hypothetical protein FWH06_01945, partial [Oscillospiraceae bacterium]|nr:hypothetical protein [Oscillospiraceae bacterium]